MSLRFSSGLTFLQMKYNLQLIKPNEHHWIINRKLRTWPAWLNKLDESFEGVRSVTVKRCMSKMRQRFIQGQESYPQTSAMQSNLACFPLWQDVAMGNTCTSMKASLKWAVTFAAHWWIQPGVEGMRFSCATVCVYPTETAALMPCSPSQVIHTGFTLLPGSQCSLVVQNSSTIW